ncbi:unnamed protein product [Calicophoron daubneyi]|uniref:PDZ domain-containing protein n=1 Tax=Calicophoron daubneyi TaxID=300641 RepID=A0AAV2T4G9_CALDB
MPLYPTFEDVKVADIISEQNKLIEESKAAGAESYAELASFMGLSLTNFHYNDRGELIPGPDPSAYPNSVSAATCPPVPVTPPNQQVCVAQPPGAVVTAKMGPGEIKQGVRKIIACKNEKNKLGVQLRAVDNGIFVALVQDGSPAAMAGLRFGDQILSIGDKVVSCMSSSKAMDLIRKAPANNIEILVRDRPFERTILLHKNSSGDIGLTIHKGLIKCIHKDSSAARNGVLINHQIVEINGRNVMGLKDKDLSELIGLSQGQSVRITILPLCIYDHLVKHLSSSQVKREMDRSLPDA